MTVTNPVNYAGLYYSTGGELVTGKTDSIAFAVSPAKFSVIVT